MKNFIPSHAPALAFLAALALAGCGTPGPAPQFYQLRLDAPQAAAAPAPRAGNNWQLTGPIRLPEYLERDVLWMPVGSAGLQALTGQRWAEPLRDAVPRLLLHDLARLRGADRVWAGAIPPGVVISLQLRLELFELAIGEDRRSVRLRARCVASEVGGTAPARVIDIELSAPAAGNAADQLVAAHRLALWMLAQQLNKRLAPEPV